MVLSRSTTICVVVLTSLCLKSCAETNKEHALRVHLRKCHTPLEMKRSDAKASELRTTYSVCLCSERAVLMVNSTSRCSLQATMWLIYNTKINNSRACQSSIQQNIILGSSAVDISAEHNLGHESLCRRKKTSDVRSPRKGSVIMGCCGRLCVRAVFAQAGCVSGGLVQVDRRGMCSHSQIHRFLGRTVAPRTPSSTSWSSAGTHISIQRSTMVCSQWRGACV